MTESVVGKSERVDIYGKKSSDSWEFPITNELFSNEGTSITGLTVHVDASMILASPELVSFLEIEGADLSGAAALISSQGKASGSERFTFADGPDRLNDTTPIAANLEIRPVLATLMNDSM